MLATSPPAVAITTPSLTKKIKNAHCGNPYLCQTLKMAGMNLSSSICVSTAIYRVLLRLSLSQRFIAHCKAMPIYPELFVHHSSFIIPPCVSGCLSFIMHPFSSDLVLKSLATQIPIESQPAFTSLPVYSSNIPLEFNRSTPFFGEQW